MEPNYQKRERKKAKNQPRVQILVEYGPHHMFLFRKCMTFWKSVGKKVELLLSSHFTDVMDDVISVGVCHIEPKSFVVDLDAHLSVILVAAVVVGFARPPVGVIEIRSVGPRPKSFLLLVSQTEPKTFILQRKFKRKLIW